MIGATTSRAPAAGRSWRRRWIPALAGLGLAALATTACGGAGTTAATPAASSSPAPTGTQAAFPGVVGTAAAVSGSSMEVQNPTAGQVTVTFTTATAITETVAVTSSDVTVGSCVTVVGQPSASGAAASGGAASRTVAATTVTVATPVKGNCNAAGFGGFGGPRGTSSPRASFSPRPRPSGTRSPFGGRGAFGGANGKVTSLSASGFVVQGRNPAAGARTTITVTTSAATKYLKVVSARPSALKVGQCITALGPANSIGTVAARTIRISQPGPNGCVTGFGRRGGPGSNPAGAAGNA
jgi:hypothetical protein